MAIWDVVAASSTESAAGANKHHVCPIRVLAGRSEQAFCTSVLVSAPFLAICALAS